MLPLPPKPSRQPALGIYKRRPEPAPNPKYEQASALSRTRPKAPRSVVELLILPSTQIDAPKGVFMFKEQVY
jgi:hypothetical protein